MEQHIAFSGKLQMHVIDLNNLCPKAIHKLFFTTPHINKIIQNKKILQNFQCTTNTTLRVVILHISFNIISARQASCSAVTLSIEERITDPREHSRGRPQVMKL